MSLKNGNFRATAQEMQVNENTGASRQITAMTPLDTSKQIAGQVTGTPAGAFVRGPNVYNPDGFLVGGHPSNTSFVGVSTVSGTQGWSMGAGVSQYLMVENLKDVYLTVAVAGEKFMWMMA